MHFGHPKTITTFKNRNFLKIWVFQGFPYTRLGSDLAILSPFWGKKFQNPCKKCPSHGENFLKIFLFFKNVPNSPRIHFGHPKIITNHQKPLVSDFSHINFELAAHQPPLHSQGRRGESLYTLLGKFSIAKKLWHFESRIVVRSSLIYDDFTHTLR